MKKPERVVQETLINLPKEPEFNKYPKSKTELPTIFSFLEDSNTVNTIALKIVEALEYEGYALYPKGK